MPRRSVIQKPNIKRFHDALMDSSVDVKKLYEKLDLSYDVMSAEDSSISMGKYLQLMEVSAQVSNNRYLSVDRALERDDTSIGLLSYMIKSAKNFSAALDILKRYLSLVSPGSEIRLQDDSDDTVILIYSSGDFPVAQCIQDVEGTVVQLIKMLRTGLNDENWWPETLYFQHSDPALETVLVSPFKTNTVYEHHFNGLRFSRMLLDHPLDDYDPLLLKVLEPQAKKDAEALEPSDNLLKRIQAIIYRELGVGGCDAESISAALGMSRSSLQRRLSELGVTITDVREDIVFNMAKQKLSSSSVSVTELSMVLGYSESSSFVRAFKRSTGVTPLQYRKKHQSV